MNFWTIIAIVAAILFFVVVALVYNALSLWLQAILSRTPVSLISIVMMRFRKVNPTVIVTAQITAKKAGIDVSTDKLEAHYMAGGRVTTVIQALVSADKANIELGFDRAAAIDLAGRNVKEAVNTSVNPKVINVPSSEMGRNTIDAIAGDGIQVKVRARVTVRTNLDRLVGGATEETIIARVGEGIVTTIGSAENHMRVLENPDNISKVVLERGLDNGTAFEILSIDIADIDIGDNIGARLQIDKAQADKQIAQAEAERRRAMAIAQEQEMKARVEENRALVILAEAEIPKAIAEAFRSGNLGIMDYYNLRNLQADTDMRKSIADEDDESTPPSV